MYIATSLSHTYHSLSHAHHMIVTCSSHDCHMLVTSLSHGCHIITTCCHMLITRLLLAHHMLVTRSSHAHHMLVTCMSHAGLPEGCRGAGCTALPSDEGPTCGQQAHMPSGGGANGAPTEVSSARSTLSFILYLTPDSTMSVGEFTSVFKDWAEG